MLFSPNASRRMRDIAEVSTSPAECKAEIDRYLKGIKLTVLHSQVLVAHYIQPGRSKGGILMTDKKVQEDRFQGNCFLVVALGKGAFKDDHIAKFHGDKLKVGEWVMALTADGIGMDINGVPCRLYQDSRILMKVDDPSLYN